MSYIDKYCRNRTMQHRDNVHYINKLGMYRVQISLRFSDKILGCEFDLIDAHATLQRELNRRTLCTSQTK